MLEKDISAAASHLPKISGYWLNKYIGISPITGYLLAIFENASGKVFTKIYKSGVTSVALSSFREEVKSQVRFSELTQRYKIKVNGFTFCTPTVKIFIDRQEEYIFGTEYSEWRSVSALASKNQIEIILSTISYLNALTLRAKPSLMRGIKDRSSLALIAIYFITLFRAISIHPGDLSVFLSGVHIFLKSMPKIISEKKSISHRDIKSENLLIDSSGKKIMVLDNQWLSISPWDYDLVNSLRLMWGNNRLKKRAQKHLEEILNNKNKEYLSGLMVYSVTHALSNPEHTHQRKLAYRDLLCFITKHQSEI